MKALIQSLSLLFLFTLAFASIALRAQDAPPPSPDDQQDTSFQTFYDNLSSQGNWIQTDNYGYVFQPNVQDPNWAPYMDGHWAYTDQGWMWVSDEPWGWATYHYGRWANIDGTGWVWVPGYQWAPAWVSWRYGGGYAGWAPLPPESFAGAEYGDGGLNIGIGFHFGGDVDVNFGIGAGCYNFVQVGDLCRPSYHGYYADRSRNYVIINNTTNVTNINVNRNQFGGPNRFRGVSVGGPSLAEVNAHSRTHFQTVHLTEANQPGRSTLHGNSLAVYAPRVNPATAHDARPANVTQTINHPTFNRGNSINKPLQVTSTVHAPAPSQAAVHAAETAQLHAPAKAHIATANTPVRRPLNTPLSSMQPLTSHTANPSANVATPSVHHPEASAFTGEPKTPAVTHSETNKPAESFHPSTQANPYTGEPKTPAVTHHEENRPAESFHPQTESAPPVEHHVEHPVEHPVEHSTQSFHPSTGGGEPPHVAPPSHSSGGPQGGGKPSAKEEKKPDNH